MKLEIKYTKDALPVLVAGFGPECCYVGDEVLSSLHTFSSEEGNKLFPPYHDDDKHYYVQFRTKNVANNIVSFTKGPPEIWVDKILD